MSEGNIRTAWIKRLRESGLHQIFGEYRDEQGCCAIGAAFPLIGEDEYTPTEVIKKKLGLTDLGFNAIVGLNDWQNLSFAEIADLFESEPEKYFVESN